MEIVGKLCPVKQAVRPSGHTWNVSYTTICTRDCAAFRDVKRGSDPRDAQQKCAMMPGDWK